MPKVAKGSGPVEDSMSDKISKQFKDYSTGIDTDTIKAHSSRLAKGVMDGTSAIGKGVSEGSVVVGKSVMKGSRVLGENVVKGSKAAAKGVVHGTELLGKGTVAAAKGIKHGVEVGYEGMKHFLGFTADKLHLKKPDMHALDEFEEEVSAYLPTEVAKRWYNKNVKLKPQQGKGKLVLKWNRVFCWHESPFEVKVMQPIDDFFVCDKKKKSALNMFLVKQYQFGRITGDEGSGKTTFLHWIHWELEAHHPEVVPCFVDATRKNVGERGLIKQIMNPFLNMYQKTVSRPYEEISVVDLADYVRRKVSGKPFVLLIDEPHNISEKAFPIIEALEKAKVKLQLIVAGRKEDLRKTYMGKNHKDLLKFELHGLDTHLARQLLQKRIEAVGGEGTYPFDGQKISVLVKQSHGNPAQLLRRAKEKIIQLSIDHREEVIADQKERIRVREETIKQKYLEEKEKKRVAREEKRQKVEEERRGHMQKVEKKRQDDIKHHEEVLASEDVQLSKIDDMIGSLLGGNNPEKKEEKEYEKEERKVDDSELEKNDALVHDAVGKIPVEKSADQILDEDPELAADLKHVLEETADAHKKQTKKKKRG
jgi:hypothetical protein